MLWMWVIINVVNKQAIGEVFRLKPKENLFTLRIYSCEEIKSHFQDYFCCIVVQLVFFLTWIYFLQVLCLDLFIDCAYGAGFLWAFLVFCLVNSLKLWILFLVISARAPFPRWRFKLPSLFKLKALCNEYRAICSVAEGLYDPIYQYIIQETCVVIRHELLIYQHFSIKL